MCRSFGLADYVFLRMGRVPSSQAELVVLRRRLRSSSKRFLERR